MPDFIPRKNLDAAAWASNFTSRILDNAQRYDIPSDRIEDLRAKHTAFAEAMTIATTPNTRTSGAIINKDCARKSFEKSARLIAHHVRAAMSSDPKELLLLGLIQGPGRSARRHRIPAPKSAPIITVAAVRGNFIDINLSNVDAPSKRGKTRDIKGAIIFTCVGKDEPQASTDWQYHASTTHTSVTVALQPGLAPGTKVWITGCWVGTRMQRTTMATPVYEHVGLSTNVPTSSPKRALFRTRVAG